MKQLFIPVQFDEKIELSKKIIAALPKRLGLVGTTQFTNQLPQIKAQLEKAGKEA